MTDAPHAAHSYDSKVAEWAVLLGSMAGVLMQALDTTIANVEIDTGRKRSLSSLLGFSAQAGKDAQP